MTTLISIDTITNCPTLLANGWIKSLIINEISRSSFLFFEILLAKNGYCDVLAHKDLKTELPNKFIIKFLFNFTFKNSLRHSAGAGIGFKFHQDWIVHTIAET